MAYQVIDAYGSVISIQSSVFGSEHRQIVGASIIGTFPVTISGNTSISGAVTFPAGSIATVVNPAGSVTGVRTDNASVITVLQTPSIIAVPTGNQSVSGAVTFQAGSIASVTFPAGSVAAVSAIFPAGSIASVTNPAGSITSTVSPPGSVTSITIPAGSVTAVLSTNPAGSITSVTNPAGSVTAVLATIAAGSITSVTNPAASVTQVRTDSASVITTQIAGSVMGVRTDNASVITVSTNVGSVITVFQNSSILSVPVGSTIVMLQAPSIVGTYAEDAAHTTADKGVFALAVRNDAVASFVSADLDYGPIGTDSAGRALTKPFAAEQSRIEGYNSVVSGSVTTLVGAAGTGLKNYITDIVLVNTGAATTLVTFRSGGGTSVLGYGIAPTGAGSNMLNWATPLRTLANETFDFQATTSTSVLYAKVSGFKAP